jgi:hypothetical protein
MRIERTTKDTQQADTHPLTDAAGLLKSIWPESCRPSRRWLDRQKKAKRIPFVKLGGLVFYSPEKVRIALEERQTVRGGAR